MPGGRSRVRPRRFATNTSQFSGISLLAISLVPPEQRSTFHFLSTFFRSQPLATMRSYLSEASIDEQFRCGDVAAVVGREKHHRPSDFFSRLLKNSNRA